MGPIYACSLWLTLWAATTADTQIPDHWQMERFLWQGAPGAARALQVHNPHGDLRLRASKDGQVHVSAVIQRHAQDFLQPAIEIDPQGEPLRIEARFDPGGETPAVSPSPEARNLIDRRRIDLVVFVPPELTLEATTNDGLVQAKGLSNPLKARSRTGRLHLLTQGQLEASTEGGDILASLGDSQGCARSRFETVSGQIEIWLPRQADTTVRVETYGRLTTDFSVEISYPGIDPMKQARLVLGEGQGQVRVTSDTGDIKLFRSPP